MATESYTPERPILITVLCVIGIGALLLTLPFIPRMAAALDAWFVPIWMVSILVTFASLIGYWRMRRWGVYLYATAFLAGTVLGIVAGLPFTVQGVIVPLAVIAIGGMYFRQMR